MIADDGHFVDVTATVTSVIPEPGTALLLGVGLFGLSAHKPRRESNKTGLRVAWADYLDDKLRD